jgi:hypothetical protein
LPCFFFSADASNKFNGALPCKKRFSFLLSQHAHGGHQRRNRFVNLLSSYFNNNMKRLVLILAGVLMIQLTLSTCKRYRAEQDNIAEYVFVTSAGTCSGANVSGHYHAGVDLASDNTISVQVNVTKIGGYTISTTNVNGVQFSATGKFNSTGMQTVTLHGTGKPAANGNFTYNITGQAGCAFLLAVTEKTVDYAVYTVFETSLVCQEPVLHGRLVKGVPLLNTNVIIFNVHVIAPGAFVVFTDSVNGIYFTASGTFTTTGDQTVTLHGFGTPADAGNFYFNLHAANGTCSFQLSCATL